jgi:type IX secretion system PorP/SprF family membrane protein
LKKRLLSIILIITSLSGMGQQLPFYTQSKNNAFLINPAITGTKREIDARINYRMQWVGYDQAPKTNSIGIHSRFFKGKMGAGLFLLQDKIGPSEQTHIGAMYAYHIRFPDCELSFGGGGNFTKYTLNGSMITIHNTQDPSIDQNINNSTWLTDANIGLYLYNDRFHFGLSARH